MSLPMHDAADFGDAGVSSYTIIKNTMPRDLDRLELTALESGLARPTCTERRLMVAPG